MVLYLSDKRHIDLFSSNCNRLYIHIFTTHIHVQCLDIFHVLNHYIIYVFTSSWITIIYLYSTYICEGLWPLGGGYKHNITSREETPVLFDE